MTWTCAARCTTVSQPVSAVRRSVSGPMSPTANPGSRVPAGSERKAPRTWCPSLRSNARSAPPTKPPAPVTRTVVTAATRWPGMAAGA
jgi:hypothetical protein